MLVSIPHGGLRTDLLCNVSMQGKPVSIPHGGLRTSQTRHSRNDLVSIPHGGLRTPKQEREGIQPKESFTLSPSHTVGLERQTTTLTKIRHINHFVKRAPLSNEVNFPKSEIMQS
jgi:hypothetical protein